MQVSRPTGLLTNHSWQAWRSIYNKKNKNKAKVSERNMLKTRSNRHNANYACHDAWANVPKHQKN